MSLDNFFDVAHDNSLVLVKVQEDKEVLLVQKQSGIQGVWYQSTKKLV